jgi:hypothetical protein
MPDAIKNWDFASHAIACKAKPGVCFEEAKCSTCGFAEKHVRAKLLYDLIEGCPSKREDGMCDTRLCKCDGVDCMIANRTIDAAILVYFPK